MRLFLSCGLLVWGVFIGCMEGIVSGVSWNIDGDRACSGIEQQQHQPQFMP